MRLMRDAFIDYVYESAQTNSDIVFLSADFGAAALDRFRVELKSQFIHCGISEQNMVDVGAGLAIAGKQPILYAMAPFLLHRAYEQIKSVVSAMNLPVTFLSVGCGLGYDHATFTHFTPEDVAIAKGLNHMEVWAASDAQVAEEIARFVIKNPKLRYIRLERNPMPSLDGDTVQGLHDSVVNGFRIFGKPEAKTAVVTSGYLTHKALEAQKIAGDDVAVIDLLRIKPLSPKLIAYLGGIRKVVTVEEQLLEGGVGSGVLEAMASSSDLSSCRFIRMGLQDGFDVFNGDRDFLLEKYGLSVNNILEMIKI